LQPHEWATSPVGTQLYLSPEIVEGKSYNNKVSVGIDLKELAIQLPKCLKFCPGIEILKPIFTQKCASVDMNWGGCSTPDNSNPEQSMFT